MLRNGRATFAQRYRTDPRFRARVSLHTGLTINLAYIVMKLSAGLYYHSLWFVSLAAYYLLLAAMRLSLVQYANRRSLGDDLPAELRRCRLCGILLLLMHQALAAIVILMVVDNRGFHYPGPLIYAMAFYAFYAMIAATVNVLRTRRQPSPILLTTRVVGLVAAMVSLLSLETAMLARFGGDDDPMFRRVITGATGGAVCALVILMAVGLIVYATKGLNREKCKLTTFRHFAYARGGEFCAASPLTARRPSAYNESNVPHSLRKSS